MSFYSTTGFPSSDLTVKLSTAIQPMLDQFDRKAGKSFSDEYSDEYA